MPSVEIANMPPNSHDVGLRTPRTTMKPNDPASITSGSNRISMPPGTTFSGSGGAWSASSLAGGGGSSRWGRATSTVPMSFSKRPRAEGPRRRC